MHFRRVFGKDYKNTDYVSDNISNVDDRCRNS